MAKSSSRGHEIYYDGEYWRYSDTKEIIDEICDEDIPKSWYDRCSDNGHERYTDDNGVRRFLDNNKSVCESKLRPCARCGHYPNEKGDDFCIQNLGYVVNACCGHGTHEGYIMFDDGTVIRGYFTVERRKDFKER